MLLKKHKSQLSDSLPSWLRLCISCRTPLPKALAFANHFHLLALDDFQHELRRFVQIRLPQCDEQQVIEVSNVRFEKYQGKNLFAT